MVGKAGLITVLGFATVIGYVSSNMHRMATNSVGNMSSYNEATASHNLAVTGANVGLAKFYADTSWFGSVTQTLSSARFGGSFTMSMTDLGGNVARLRSVSTYNGHSVGGLAETLHDTIEVYFDKRKRNSFSMFAWMTQFEGNVFWITGDTVWGRVHSNGQLHVNGKPVFMEKVTTAKSFNPKPGTGTNKAIFKNGYETGVAPIDFPNDLSEIIVASTSGGRKYVGDIWVTLSSGSAANNDGKAYVRATETGPIIDSIALNDPSSFNGALLGTGKVNVQGQVDGKLTIASMTYVVVRNDIVYEQNPRFTDSDDLLGLVGENNVVVADNAANNSNCEIHACIFARTNSFTAENYSTRPVSGELRLLGSIVQKNRGPVGTFSGSTIKSGFSKRYRYDTRLSDPDTRPPFYPGFYVKTYAITNWWESFRVPEIR